MVVVVSTNTPKLQSTHYPVRLRVWLSQRQTEGLGGSPGWTRQPGFSSCRSGSLLEGLYFSSMPKHCLTSRGRCPSPSWVPRWEGSGGNTGVRSKKLLLHSGALSTLRCPKCLMGHFTDRLQMR